MVTSRDVSTALDMTKRFMSGKIVTREFSVDDYDAALHLWQRVEGLEGAEGDDKEGVAQFVARNPGLSRGAIDGSRGVGVAVCGRAGRRGSVDDVAVGLVD